MTRRLLRISVALLLGLLPVAARGARLDPNAPEFQRPLLDPAADAEVVLSETSIEDHVIAQGFQREETHHTLTKVFTEQGAGELGEFGIPYWEGATIEHLVVSCIDPDGRVRTSWKEAAHERTLLRWGRFALKARVLILENVRAGSLIDVRYRYTWLDAAALHHVVVPVQQPYPVRSWNLKVRPWVEYPMVLRWTPAAGGFSPPVLVDGTYEMSGSGVPAWRPEPFMPTGVFGRFTVVGHYSNPTMADWRRLAPELGRGIEVQMVDGAAVLDSARVAIRGATTVRERVERLWAWCRTFAHAGRTDTLEASGDVEPVSVTLRTRSGNGPSIALLFATVARAAGLTVQPVFVIPREAWAFDSSVVIPELLKPYLFRVAIDGGWCYLEPAHPFTVPGQLHWTNEGCVAIVAATPPERLRLPVSRGDDARVERVATLTLAEDGTLSGDVVVRRSGQAALSWWQSLGGSESAEIERAVLEGHRRDWESASFSGFEPPAEDPLRSELSYRFHVTLPAYAEPLGAGWLLQPGVLQRGESPVFAQESRRQPVFLDFAWVERDTVRIALPAGCRAELDSVGTEFDRPGFGRFRLAARMSADGRELTWAREAAMGAAGTTTVPPYAYAAARAAMARQHRAEQASVAITRAPAGAGEP